MDLEMDKWDDQDKPNFKRRSSILKLPKIRNPFEEIDTTETYTEISMTKSVRRVSFASSNFIKPFVTDPEKNTIWDTTYEEDVNHTNSTQSSQEQTANSCLRSASTLIETTTLNATNRNETDMNLTTAIDKENVPLNPLNLSFVEYAKNISRNKVKPVFDLNNLKSFRVFDDEMEMTNIQEELDCTIKQEDTVSNKTEMEFTCQISKDNQIETNSIPMEFTCQITNQSLETETKENLNGIDMELSGEIAQLKEPETKEAEMEFTCQITQSDIDIELTSQVPEISKKLTFSGDMELTCEVPSQVATNLEKTVTDMEFTCQIPPITNTKLNETSMDFNEKSCSAMEIDQTYVSKAQTPLKDTSSHSINKTFSKNQSQQTFSLIEPPIVTPKKSQIPLHASSSLRLTPDKQKQRVKIPTLSFLKHELSALRTPEQSFHINFSSGVDDTQQLLECNFSKSHPVCLMASRYEDTSLGLSLKDVKDATKPNLSLDFTQKNISSIENSIDVPRRKLLNINDTYFINDKKNSDKKDSSLEETSWIDDSLGLIPGDCIQELDSDKEVSTPDMLKLEEIKTDKTEKCVKKLEFKKYELKVIDNTEINKLLETINSQREYIINYLKNYQVPPIVIPPNFTIFEKSSDLSESLNELNESEEVVCLSVEEKIKQHQESCKKCWKLEKTENDFYHFSTLFGTLLFVVQIDLETGKVMNLKTENKLADKSQPLARFILKLFLNKLQENTIRSALGANYDVLSILDYIQMIMLKLNKFQKFFLTCDMISMDEDFTVMIKILSCCLGLSCQVFIKTENLDYLNIERDVEVVVKYGKLKPTDLKNLTKNCPKGLDFIKCFVENIREFIKSKEKI